MLVRLVSILQKDRGDHLGQDSKMVWPRGYRELDQHRRQRCGKAAHCAAGPKGEVNGKDSILLHFRHPWRSDVPAILSGRAINQ